MKLNEDVSEAELLCRQKSADVEKSQWCFFYSSFNVTSVSLGGGLQHLPPHSPLYCSTHWPLAQTEGFASQTNPSEEPSFYLGKQRSTWPAWRTSPCPGPVRPLPSRLPADSRWVGRPLTSVPASQYMASRRCASGHCRSMREAVWSWQYSWQ